MGILCWKTGQGGCSFFEGYEGQINVFLWIGLATSTCFDRMPKQKERPPTTIKQIPQPSHSKIFEAKNWCQSYISNYFYLGFTKVVYGMLYLLVYHQYSLVNEIGPPHKRDSVICY